jgi:hypothetical protein
LLTKYEKVYKSVANTSDCITEYYARRNCIEVMGFAILTESAIKMLKPYMPFVEVGAGTGYWSYELQKRGIITVATDPIKIEKSSYKFKQQWTVIEKMTAKQAIKKYPKHTLMMIWPCYDKPWAYEALKAYKGDTFVYCGESQGGCTADDNFHELLEKEWQRSMHISIPQWFGIHDYLDVYVRK